MKNQKQSGFTLIELMVTLVVAAVVLGLAAPSFSQFLKNNRMTAAANELLGAVQFARSEAIKSHVPTVMCFSAAPETAPACNGTSTGGWIVFSDANSNGLIDTGEAVLLRHSAVQSPITINRFRPVTSTGKYVSFLPSGFSGAIPGFGTPLTSVVLCDERRNVALAGSGNSAARAVIITSVGRPSVTNSVTQITSVGSCP